MKPTKNKIIQDTIHGYITIPSDYCNKIIDTALFQRLRRIEQTSIRSVYPCAHHERFVHSLGTYYLGNKIFNHIKYNAEIDEDKTTKKALKDKDWEKIGVTYQLACLLHDCGHAPFSHTLEFRYDKSNDLNKILKDLVDKKQDNNFHDDFDKQFEANPHEKVSAILLLQNFKEVLEELNANPFLAARMIIGCKYLDPKDNFEKIANCFILLLNGGIIDADRLDYAKRDTWASGYSAIQIDFERLLSAICIKYDNKGEDEFKVCFHKKAICDIPRILEIKDFQNSWIFSHHKILYDQELLIKSIEQLSKIIAKESCENNLKLSSEDVLKQIFNIEAFQHKCKIGFQDFIYLPADGDILYLLKRYIDNNEYAKEWFSRNHILKPLWKSYHEFFALFKGLSKDKLKKNGALDKNAEKNIQSFLEKHNFPKNSYLKKEAKNSTSTVDSNKVNIFINNEIKNYEELGIRDNSDSEHYFFYLYIPQELINKKDDIIKLMRKV